ncbi:ATP-binding protein [Sporomusa sphaeroides]|uniref:AAA+ ATPase domain-containing protein n=1 Tax=Sporomusa sphaeroides DSM 2875 TaxID=1337886 RepID=A0ABM9W0M6_9FIRM|nr:ATP-binding protein [Sporomusa sphaeroides]OLS56321.1 hypothetical protein SPSPH_27140 [Sporomusa sphaeroides DSM 2875]CVK18416.1 hypothetical protein SSPH_01054 [Sporomusa sphaeroides DSM 2875]
MEFKTAERKRAKLRLGITGPSGAGKTYSALLVANGMAPWSSIAVIDSENGSAELYAQLGDYSVLTLTPPYDPDKYIAAIKLAEQKGFEVIIVDSLSHCWSGEGGILDQQGKATDSKFKGNSWAAWREYTPKHNALVETMLKSSCHIIATLRSKVEYAQVVENGKTTIKKLGTSAIQREGIEYEFTTVFDLSIEHIATPSKDRTGIFDGQYFKPDISTGNKLLSWLNCDNNSISKAEVTPLPPPEAEEVPDIFTSNTIELLNAYQIVSAEAKIKGKQTFVKLVLLQKDTHILAWSACADILEVPVGTFITASIVQKNGTNIIEAYSIVKGGEAA